eukprot:3804802-Rhodomonas_salina.3
MMFTCEFNFRESDRAHAACYQSLHAWSWARAPTRTCLARACAARRAFPSPCTRPRTLIPKSP